MMSKFFINFPFIIRIFFFKYIFLKAPGFVESYAFNHFVNIHIKKMTS